MVLHIASVALILSLPRIPLLRYDATLLPEHNFCASTFDWQQLVQFSRDTVIAEVPVLNILNYGIYYIDMSYKSITSSSPQKKDGLSYKSTSPTSGEPAYDGP